MLFKDFLVFPRTHPEVPDRIQRPYDKHKEYGLLERCQEIPVSNLLYGYKKCSNTENIAKVYC